LVQFVKINQIDELAKIKLWRNWQGQQVLKIMWHTEKGDKGWELSTTSQWNTGLFAKEWLELLERQCNTCF